MKTTDERKLHRTELNYAASLAVVMSRLRGRKS
jgi:hypothetical protein